MTNLAFTGKSELVNQRLLQHSNTMEQRIYKVAENIYTAVGFGLENPTIIEGKDGIIVIDPGETLEVGKQIMAEFRKITDKPVKAVIISHSHSDHWAGMKACVTEEQARNNEVLVIAHKKLPYNISTSNGQLADIRVGRAIWMYGSVLPQGEDGVVNMGAGPVLLKGSVELVTPNTYIEDNEVRHMNICGVDLDIIHCPSETDDHIVVFVTKSRVLHCADAIQAEAFPNIYTVRGQNRDAVMWYKGIDMLRELAPDYLIGCHMRPIEGREQCMELLTDYRDVIQYTHDQTVRLINMGYTPDYIVEELCKLPDHLYQKERIGEFYGTFVQTIRAVYDTHIGWFNGEPSKLNPLAPRKASEKYVELMGGKEKVLTACIDALEKKEYQWCAELCSHLIRLDNKDMQARNCKAKAVRQLGCQAENATWRNWYLTCAIQLEGAFEQIAEKTGPNGGFPSFSATIKELPLELMLDAYKCKLNGPRSQSKHLFMAIQIQENCFTLEVRRGVLQIHSGKIADHCPSVILSQATLACLMAKDYGVSDGVEKGLIETKNMKETQEFFELFDGFTSFINMPFCFE